jgi:hypothetical protein
MPMTEYSGNGWNNFAAKRRWKLASYGVAGTVPQK